MRERGRMFVAQADKAFLQEWADQVSGRFKEWVSPDHFLSVIVDELRQVRSQANLFDDVPSRIERAALRLAREDQADSDRRGADYYQGHRIAVENQASRVESDEAHHQAVASRETIAYRAMEKLRGKVPPAMLDKLLSHVEAAMGDKVLAMTEPEIRALVHHKLADIERLRADREGDLTDEAREQLNELYFSTWQLIFTVEKYSSFLGDTAWRPQPSNGYLETLYLDKLGEGLK